MTTKPTILPPLPAVGKRRLRKLIAFLRQLPRRKFDFTIVTNECHSVGCAIGWVPSLFPQLASYGDWKLFQNFIITAKTPHLKRDSLQQVSMDIFEMPCGHHLVFAPDSQHFVHVDLPRCGNNATPKQVASMLEKYILLTETETK